MGSPHVRDALRRVRDGLLRRWEGVLAGSEGEPGPRKRHYSRGTANPVSGTVIPHVGTVKFRVRDGMAARNARRRSRSGGATRARPSRRRCGTCACRSHATFRTEIIKVVRFERTLFVGNEPLRGWTVSAGGARTMIRRKGFMLIGGTILAVRHVLLGCTAQM